MGVTFFLPAVDSSAVARYF